MNAFKQGLEAGRPVVMVNVGGRNPDIVAAVARHGADAAFIDCERSGIGLDAAAELLFAAKACGLPSLVRSHSADPAELIRYLDRGADGLVIPHCRSVDEARAATELMRFAFGAKDHGKTLILQIETRGAVEALEDIAGLPGVDGFLIGPNDLAWELCGERGARNARMTQVLDDVCARLSRMGKRHGMPCRAEELPLFRQRGCTLIYYAIDWLVEIGMQTLQARLRA